MSSIYLQGTQNRAVLLLHAYTGTSADVRLLGTALNQKGYAVYMPELSGHGTKDMRNILAATVEQWIEDVDNAVQFLIDKGFQQIAVFGLSMGGMLALLQLTNKKSYIIGGGSFNSPVPLVDSERVKEQFLVYAQKLYTQDLGNKHEYDQFIATHVVKQLENIQQLTYVVSEKLPQIDVPVYIAQSGCDELIDVTIGQTMANRMVFTNVSYHFFEHAKHAITVGADRKVFNDTVITFVEQLGWGE